MYLTKQQAEIFYSFIKKTFFDSLVSYMTSGPVQVQVLEEEAVSTYRKIMGATNPEEADEGTIRKLQSQLKQILSMEVTLAKMQKLKLISFSLAQS